MCYIFQANNQKKVFMPKRGQISDGHIVPYGTFTQADSELRHAYYYYGYRRDEDMPALPCSLPELAEEICPEEEMFKKEMVQLIDDQLKTLHPRYAKVLRMRHGIDTGIDHTLEEVGRAFDLTRERIRQMEGKGMRLLKEPHRRLKDLARPEEYKTSARRKRDQDELQKKWVEEQEKQDRYIHAARYMPTKKKELWDELKPALEDAEWMRDLKYNKPDMYQELKDLVRYLWDDSAERVWNTYTRKEHHE